MLNDSKDYELGLRVSQHATKLFHKHEGVAALLLTSKPESVEMGSA